MRRIAFFVIILGICATANAVVIVPTIDARISSLNGQPVAPTYEITITPSDTVDFQITYRAPSIDYLFCLSVKLNVSGTGSLEWGVFIPMPMPTGSINPGFNSTSFQHGPDWIIAGTVTPIQGNGTEIVVIEDILLHCDGPGDVALWLSNYGTGSMVVDSSFNQIPFQYGNGFIIHQVIPEPMTFMLLGLGSLYLLRRKR